MSATVMCNTKLKYNGQVIPARTPFEVGETEVEEFVAMGCQVLRHTKQRRKLSALDIDEKVTEQ